MLNYHFHISIKNRPILLVDYKYKRAHYGGGSILRCMYFQGNHGNGVDSASIGKYRQILHNTVYAKLSIRYVHNISFKYSICLLHYHDYVTEYILIQEKAA